MHLGDHGMGRRGRPRAAGERYPSGKLKPAEAQESGRDAAAWNRLKEDGIATLVDPRIGTAIGRAAMLGRLTARQAVAAFLIGEAYGRHERLQGLPPRNAASPDYQRAYSGALDIYARGDDNTITAHERRVSKARKRFERVSSLIPAGRVRFLIEALCIEGTNLNELELDAIKPTLDSVARNFGS